MKNKVKILVTGGAGFIGSALAEKLISNKQNYVVIADNLSTGETKKLPQIPKDNWCFINCNVNNYQHIAEVMLSYRFNYVFHYAAVVGVLRTLETPVNVLNDLHGIEHILILSKNTGVARVFFASSSEVYGEPVEIPQHVYTTPLNSRLPYAIVKNAGEAFLKAYNTEFGINYTIFRFFNTYGPKQSKDFVISKFISKAMKNEEIQIYGDGSQTRTFCYIDDNITATTNAFYNNLLINDVANIGSDNEMTVLSLAEKIIRLTNSKSKIKHVEPLKEGDMTRRLPVVDEMKILLKKKLISLDDGLKNIIKNPLFIE